MKRQSLLDLIRAARANPTARAEILAEARRRADEVEPWLHAFCFRPAAYPAPAAGPLSGIPVGVKDIIATKDMPTCYNSAIFAGHQPDADAWIVDRIKALGGIVFGKTVTTEFAWRQPGPTVNPWNRAHTPGGSSSGSAASVAAGIVPLALGTQTVGSIIRPAAYCGITGYKPSFGAIPGTGVHPLSGTLDHVGFLTVTAEDAAVAYALFAAGKPEVLGSDDAWAAYFQPRATPPRLALLRTGLWGDADAAQQENFLKAAQALREAGAEIVESDAMGDAREIFESTNIILGAEAAEIFSPMIEAHPGKVSARLRDLVAAGQKVSAAAYKAALAAQAEWKTSLDAALGGFDAVLSLPAPGAAPAGLDETGNASFCAAWTMLGWPAISIPSGWTAAGLPLGLQLSAPFGRDLELLRAAGWAQSMMKPAGRMAA